MWNKKSISGYNSMELSYKQQETLSSDAQAPQIENDLKDQIKEAEPIMIQDYREGMKNEEIIEMLSKVYVKMPTAGSLFIKDSSGEIDYGNPIEKSTLILEMQDRGYRKNFSESQWNLILNDPRIKVIEPLQVALELIAADKWSGEFRIDELTTNLNLKGDFNENKRLLTKFLCTMYATAFQGYDEVINFDAFNRVCMILFSYERGTRKTSILRKLGMGGMLRRLTGLDVDIQATYEGCLPDDKRLRNIHKATKFCVNIDDIDTLLHGRNMNSIRAMISMPDVTFRKLYTDADKTYLRRVSWVATTNNPTVLRDHDENRYMVLEIQKAISDEFMDSFDALDLWRQIRQILQQSGHHMMFNDADRELIRQRADAHLYTTELDDIIDETFEYCDECRESFEFVTERVYQRASSYNRKEIGVSIKRLSPNGIVKIKTGGTNRYKIREKKVNMAAPANKSNESCNTEDMPF
ncbi:MAG: VapE domain-containing protein [Flavobacteriaceae bacterium]